MTYFWSTGSRINVASRPADHARAPRRWSSDWCWMTQGVWHVSRCATNRVGKWTDATQTDYLVIDADRLYWVFGVLGLTHCASAGPLFIPRKNGRSALYLGCNSCNVSRDLWCLWRPVVVDLKCIVKGISRRNDLCFSLKVKIAPDESVILAENVVRRLSSTSIFTYRAIIISRESEFR